MKAILFSLWVLLMVASAGQAQVQSGKQLFTGNCQVCHSLGKGDIVGPDLAGITEKREESWIKRFINNSQELIKEGDEQALEVFKKYNSIVMPSHKFNDEELDNLISYMAEAGKEATLAKEKEQEKLAVTPSNEAAQQTEASLGGNGKLSWYLNILFGLLGASAIILSLAVACLYRLLKA